MKTMNRIYVLVIFGWLLMSTTCYAQEEKTYLITVTKLHWNMELENFSMDEWKATEKEYLDKVVKKNEFILGQEFLMHHFTPDNTEILLVTTYENWSAIEKAGDRSEALEKAAWPDEKARRAFFEKKANYYALYHSDEIYASMPGAKLPKANFTTDVLYYVRVSHFTNPKDGSEKEFKELSKEYLDAVINKNDLIKAYYPNEHAWGADKTEFTEVFVVETLADLEKALEKNRELFRATWNDDAKRKAYWDKRNKYDDGRHSDYIYRLIHELTK